jgi:hypothetical protein
MSVPIMMKITRLLALSTSIFISTLAGAMQPDAPTAYFSIDAGYGTSGVKVNNLGSGNSVNGSGAIWGGNFGVLFTPNVGIEVGYLNGGNATIKTNGTTSNFITNSYFYTLALKGILYSNEYDLSLFGKAGVAQGHVTYPVDSGFVTTKQSVTRYTPYFAIGVAQNVTAHLAVALVAQATVQQGSNPDTNLTPYSTLNTLPALYAGTLEVTYAF